mmetsp:Transcript_16606/g.21608  ORF Transcript_16606/g.21608 Transcript_16606/m.21608 type:complete len:224 (-) Transcript_16606:126-797(-)
MNDLIIPAASHVCKAWFAIPQFFRFAISGTLGNVVFFFIERNFYQHGLMKNSQSLPKLVNRHATTISFFISYLLQIVVQHVMNAALVFGLDTIQEGKYFKSLIACYMTYSTTLVASTAMNAALLANGVPKTFAFWTTLYGFGIINFILLSKISKKTTSSEPIQKDHTSTRGGGLYSRGGANEWVDLERPKTYESNIHLRPIAKVQEMSMLSFLKKTADRKVVI